MPGALSAQHQFPNNNKIILMLFAWTLSYTNGMCFINEYSLFFSININDDGHKISLSQASSFVAHL